MKTWCRHIVWYPMEDGFIGAWVSMGFDIQGSKDIPRNWKLCPICGAKRPQPKKKGK